MSMMPIRIRPSLIGFSTLKDEEERGSSTFRVISRETCSDDIQKSGWEISEQCGDGQELGADREEEHTAAVAHWL